MQTNPILRLCGCATVQVCAGRDSENGGFWTRRALHSFSSLFQRLPPSAHTSVKKVTKRDSGAFVKMRLSPQVAAPRGLALKTFMGEETDIDSPLAGLEQHVCLCLLYTDGQTAARTLKTTS